MQADDLLRGETILLSKNANAVITLSDSRLRPLTAELLMGLFGMKGKEAIGGRLHVTTYRVLFQAHPINRLRGKCSIFLSTITDVEDVSVLLTRKLQVRTQHQSFEFVVWGIPHVMAVIKQARENLSPAQSAEIGALAAQNPEKCGDGLRVVKP